MAKMSIRCVAKAAATSQGHGREMRRSRAAVVILRGPLHSL